MHQKLKKDKTYGFGRFYTSRILREKVQNLMFILQRDQYNGRAAGFIDFSCQHTEPFLVV